MRGQAARLLVYSAATKMARGERAIKEVSMAKVFAADVAFKTSFNGMQALGGYAQLPEYDMERYFREAKHAMVGGGDQRDPAQHHRQGNGPVNYESSPRKGPVTYESTVMESVGQS